MLPAAALASFADSGVPTYYEGYLGPCCTYFVSANMSTPDPAFNAGQIWAHVFVGGAQTYSTPHAWSEVGVQKAADGGRYAHWNVVNSLGSQVSFEYHGVNLAPGSYHKVQTYQTGQGSTYWTATVFNIQSWGGVNTGTTGYVNAFSGEESSCSGCAMGYSDIQENLTLNGGAYYVPWCYSNPGNQWLSTNNFTNPQPTKSACYGTDHNSWNVLYH